MSYTTRAALGFVICESHSVPPFFALRFSLLSLVFVILRAPFIRSFTLISPRAFFLYGADPFPSSVLVIFGTISALAVGRRRRALRRQQQLAAAGVSVHPTAAGGVWSQHLAGGPAQPPQAHYNSLYAPGYMAPVRTHLWIAHVPVLTGRYQPPGPPPASEQMYPAPPKYEPNYDPPAGPPPGFSDKSNAV
jgi:hypothetical protein